MLKDVYGAGDLATGMHGAAMWGKNIRGKSENGSHYSFVMLFAA